MKAYGGGRALEVQLNSFSTSALERGETSAAHSGHIKLEETATYVH
jgi:hypothetical protein